MSSTTSSPADSPRSELIVRGMTCQNCARHVGDAIRGVPGVSATNVDLPSQRATVRWNAASPPDTGAVIQALKEAGYDAELAAVDETAAPRRRWMSGWTGNLVIGVPVTVALILCEWVFRLGMDPRFQWTAFALATAVQFYCGARFYRGAWQQLKARSSNMDTLVALGSTTAYLYSLWALFQGMHVYFMEAAAIITLISVGHWMEERMSARAASSMKKLLDLAPAEARRLSTDGEEEIVPVAALRLKDIIVLRPGERIPTDGQVVDGNSAVNEAMLTGESAPVDKEAGASVYGGTMNLNGRLIVEVSATGDATALAQIIAAVERAQTSRASIQRLGDRVSSVFVPIVVLVALATAAWWGLAFDQAQSVSAALEKILWPAITVETALAAAVVHCAAVLIIACPCAMGLATPVAIMAGTNAAAERGILIRDGIALEKAGTITAVVFDKTGTLTMGRPEVTQFESYVGGAGRPNIHEMKLAATLARRSNHPLSQAIARLYEDDLPLLDWREVSGAGVQAHMYLSESSGAPAVIRLGSLRWLEDNGVDLTRGKPFTEEWTSQGGTIVGIAINEWLMGSLAVQDTLKEGVAEVVKELKGARYEIYIVTGDNSRTATAVARTIGVDADHVAAEVRPEKKSDFVRRLQEQGKRVAFIGDGINDAPALEQADLGIAVGRATDIAKMAADIILLKADIHAVPESLGMARSTLRAIRQNLFWAFFYNAAGIPLAALGFLSPVLCAVAMGLSDLIVIGNALRLRRWRPSGWRKLRDHLTID